jgi:predicted phage-related endonuclease
MPTPPNRSEYIGSSDAKRILDGDWLALYQEKIGERPKENLDYNFPVQLGIHTESFHIGWLNRVEGLDIIAHGRHNRMDGLPHIGATLDGWSCTHRKFVEVKHSNSRATQGSMVEWYQPQIAHVCNVLGVNSGIISYIAGNEKPVWFEIEPSTHYREALLEMEQAFWWHVEQREPPQVIPRERLEQARAAKAEVKLDGMRTVDMTGSNAWATNATDYLLHKATAATFEAAKKALKDLVELDVREASGHGITIRRAKNGALLFTEVDQ